MDVNAVALLQGAPTGFAFTSTHKILAVTGVGLGVDVCVGVCVDVGVCVCVGVKVCVGARVGVYVGV